MKLQSLVEAVVKAGVPATMEFNEETNSFEYSVPGFYKSGECVLTEVDGEVVAKTRYDQRNKLESLEDLVALNYDWFLDSKDRDSGWSKPNGYWAELLIEHGYLTKKVETVTTYS